MFKFFKALTLIIAVLLTAHGSKLAAQQFYNGVPETLPYIKNPVNRTTAQFMLNTTRGDTMVITGSSLGSSYFGNVNGVDSLHPFVVYFNNTYGAGIGIEDCKYVKFIGIGTATITGGGTNGYIKGRCRYVQVSGFKNLNGYNGSWWLKLESPDACNYATPANYLNMGSTITNRMEYIWFTHNQIGNEDGSNSCGGEAVYAISTGAYGRDPVPCLGGTVYKPLWGRDFHIDSNKIYNPGRTGIQLSGCDLGTNTINGNLIVHAGRELNSSQGAGIRTGYGTSNNTEIAYNVVQGSYIYNYDLETGANFHDNIGDSAGYWKTTKNPQGIPSTIIYASLANSTVIIKNNTMGLNTANPKTGFAIYGGNNFTNDNIVCGNSPAPTILSKPFNYSSTCSTPPPVLYDTTYYTHKIVHDTLVRSTIPEHINVRDSAINTYTRTLIATVFKKKFYKRTTTKTIVTLYDTIPEHDTVFICVKCTPSHDTTEIIIKPHTSTQYYGTFILNDGTSFESRLSRSKEMGAVFRYNYWPGQQWRTQQIKDSGQIAAVTFNHSQNDGAAFPTGAALEAYKATLDSCLSVSKPDIISFQNEESNAGYWSGPPLDYINMLNEAVKIAHNHAVPCSDGGILKNVVFYMRAKWQEEGKTDSVDLINTALGINDGTNAAMQWVIDFYNVLIPGLEASNIDFINLHWYEPTGADSSISNLLPLAINFLQSRTGKSILTTESGTYNNDQTVFNSMFNQWQAAGTAFIIYFDGDANQAVQNEDYWKLWLSSL